MFVAIATCAALGVGVLRGSTVIVVTVGAFAGFAALIVASAFAAALAFPDLDGTLGRITSGKLLAAHYQVVVHIAMRVNNCANP